MTEVNGAHVSAETAAEITDDLKEMGREFTSRAEDVRKEAVKLLHSAAEKIREEAHERSIGEDATRAADEVAVGLEKAAHYLNTRSVQEMGQDAKQVVQQYPVRTITIAVVIGILIGLILRGGKR
jgi:ElaB/YqjD/DUF883 family membrane-anchored ribosome-binding protein